MKNVHQIQASHGAFAAMLGDGSVVSWGSAGCGGDSSAVQDRLKNVEQIQATGSAFAAILRDGSVVTWGNARFGGDSSAVQDWLKNVEQIKANGEAPSLTTRLSSAWAAQTTVLSQCCAGRAEELVAASKVRQITGC